MKIILKKFPILKKEAKLQFKKLHLNCNPSCFPFSPIGVWQSCYFCFFSSDWGSRNGSSQGGQVWGREDDWGRNVCQGEVRAEHGDWRERGYEGPWSRHHHQAQDGWSGFSLIHEFLLLPSWFAALHCLQSLLT